MTNHTRSILSCYICIYILSRSQILKSIVADGSALQPAQPAAPSLPNSLNERIKLWRKQVKYCDADGNIVSEAPGAFPTKESDDPGKRAANLCNDGDMLLFNGLLCASGEEIGCSAVRDSFDEKTHQWWRSPAKRKAGKDNPEEPNLNSDQVLGLLLYVLEKHDGDRLREWLEWVRGMGSPKRFCSLDTSKCYFRPEDCSLILLVGMTVGEQAVALSVCPPSDAIGFFLPASPTPKVDDVFKLYDGAVKLYLRAGKALNELQKKVGYRHITYRSVATTSKYRQHKSSS